MPLYTGPPQRRRRRHLSRPLSARRALYDPSDDVAARLDVQFYADVRDALADV
jgi:hypothetical protein